MATGSQVGAFERKAETVSLSSPPQQQSLFHARSYGDLNYYVVCDCWECKGAKIPRQKKHKHRERPRFSAGARPDAPAADSKLADTVERKSEAPNLAMDTESDVVDFTVLEGAVPAPDEDKKSAPASEEDSSSDAEEGTPWTQRLLPSLGTGTMRSLPT